MLIILIDVGETSPPCNGVTFLDPSVSPRSAQKLENFLGIAVLLENSCSVACGFDNKILREAHVSCEGCPL